MKRWHEEVPLMYRRWRKELAKHGQFDYGFSHDSLAPPSFACNVDCHCANGIGTMRKNRLDCGTPRCWLCHGEKFYAPKNRANTRRAAIEFDIEASAE
jgi:hypothetical protein